MQAACLTGLMITAASLPLLVLPVVYLWAHPQDVHGVNHLLTSFAASVAVLCRAHEGLHRA